MFAVESLILTALVALVAGVGIGILIGRSSSSAKQTKDLEQHLTKAKQELESYQQDVAKHFMDTAKKVTELTENYRDLNQHLADGALHLASTEITRDLLSSTDTTLDKKTDTQPSSVEPPKDWAPKIPGTHGMLSEEFGLKDPQEATPPPPEDAEESQKK